MPLNKAKGNMYPWVTHTWNPVKGKCPHRCDYCYMKKIYRRFRKKPAEPRLIEGHVNFGKGNTIFVCSSIDMFADLIPLTWSGRVINYAKEMGIGNTFLFHTKNPLNTLLLPVRDNFILCATIESNLWHNAMGKAPPIENRFLGLHGYSGRKMITIEPILDFDVVEFVKLIVACGPLEQVNIGADSGNNHLQEPSSEKIAALIEALRPFTRVHLKKNLKWLYKE